jgi:plastocyanin domain-containing protein
MPDFLHRTLACAMLVVGALACGDDEAPPPSADPSDGRVEIRVEADGYHPARVEARAGEPITLVFTRTTDSACAEELVIAAHDIRRDLPKDQPVEVTFTPAETGEVTFACGMDMLRGTLVVR